MTEEEYLSERLDDQIEWYSGRSGENKRAFMRWRISEIVVAATIPFAAAISQLWTPATWITGGLGVYVAVAAAMITLKRHQEIWACLLYTSPSPRDRG